MRKTLTVRAEIVELGISRTFTLAVGTDGRMHPTAPNCYVVGTPETPLIGIELATDRGKLCDFYERK